MLVESNKTGAAFISLHQLQTFFSFHLSENKNKRNSKLFFICVKHIVHKKQVKTPAFLLLLKDKIRQEQLCQVSIEKKDINFQTQSFINHEAIKLQVHKLKK